MVRIAVSLVALVPDVLDGIADPDGAQADVLVLAAAVVLLTVCVLTPSAIVVAGASASPAALLKAFVQAW